MKEVKGLFSKFKTRLKPFFNKVKSLFKPVNKALKSSMKKISYLYKKANSKNKYVEPLFVISTSCLLVLIMIISIKSFTTVEEVNIASNSAEYLYYENENDKAIEEYRKMQENDNWPIWTVKIADIYSLQGEKEKSNTLLKEALIKRDKVIKAEGYEAYKEKDLELIKSMLFTFTFNQEYGDVISFGEQYIKDYGQNKDIAKILFIAYLQNNNEYKAEELLDTYPLDEKSSHDIATYANMNILINRWDKGIDLLKEAWNIDNNDIKIFNVIREMYLFDKDSLIEELKNRINDSNEDEYKVFLAAAYSMDKNSTDKALKLINELDNKKIDTINTDLIKQEVYNNSNNESMKQEYLEDAIHKSKAIDKESYSTYYLLSLKALSNGKYDEALTYAKKSINSNINNGESFGILIPSILNGKKDFNTIEIYYREAMKKEPFNYEIILNLANYCTNYVSNDEKAKEYYKFAINLRNNNSDLYKKLAEIDIKDEKYEDAIENIKEAIEIDDNIQEYYTTLGALYLIEGNYEEGIEVTRKAYSMNDKDVRALNNAAWYYLVVEKDLLRGFENLKAAYSEISAGMTDEDKNIIIENYNSIKNAYDKYMADETEEFNIKDLKLIY
ncbi:tetratricopeptide repeat protein [Clostridium sp. HCS.1]|uniref:tetratricopeptide repeat protein n=1 Tax=Clostridium sp. HCS.1 TaxID=3238594 RepID=UPI003A0FE7B2